MSRFGLMRALAVAAALGGCSAGGAPLGGDEPVGAESEPILGGTPATSYPEAGYLNIDFTATGGTTCSSVLVAPRVALTAGHCVDGHTKWELHVGSQGRTSSSAATFDWNEHGAPTVDPNHHDIGLVFVDPPITLASYPLLAKTKVANGTKVTNVGRVHNGTAGTALYEADTTVSDGTSIGYPLSYESSDVIQAGDSGGPDFLSGTHTIVAVSSGAGGSIEVLARVDLVYDWLQAQIAAHGGAGQPPPPVTDAGVPPRGTTHGTPHPPPPRKNTLSRTRHCPRHGRR